jgi:hypothetical protein
MVLDIQLDSVGFRVQREQEQFQSDPTDFTAASLFWRSRKLSENLESIGMGLCTPGTESKAQKGIIESTAEIDA